MDIKEARKFAGLTQKQVETKLGVPARNIQNWENGVRTPTKFVEESLVQRLIQMKLVARVRIMKDRVRIETLLHDDEWEIVSDCPVVEVLENLMVSIASDEGRPITNKIDRVIPVEALKTIGKLSQDGYKIIWID